MTSSLLTFLFLIQVTGILTAVPNLSRKCKLSDSECLKNVAQEALPVVAAGMPELGTEPLDEMYIEKNRIDLAGLKLTVTNGHIKGLKKAVIKHISLDMTKKVLKISYYTDMEVKSKYKASGQLLVLPISGDGDMSLDLKNVHIEMIMPFQIVKNKDDKDILELKSFGFKYDIKDGAHSDFTNLFNGNKELSTTLLTFMNDNWKTLSEEFGTPMLEKVQKKIFTALKIYLKSRPIDDFLET